MLRCRVATILVGAGVATFCGGYGKIMLGGKKVLRVGWGGVGWENWGRGSKKNWCG